LPHGNGILGYFADFGTLITSDRMELHVIVTSTGQTIHVAQFAELKELTTDEKRLSGMYQHSIF
jgi:hypothetical protein